MMKYKILKKLACKLHWKELLIFILMCVILVGLFVSAVECHVLFGLYREFNQFAGCVAFDANLQYDFESAEQDVQRKEREFLQYLKEYIDTGKIGHFAIELEPENLKFDDGTAYFYGKEYELDQNNLEKGVGFSKTDNEVILVCGKHKIGDTIEAEYNGVKKTFNVVDKIKNHSVILSKGNPYVMQTWRDGNVYLLNPNYYDTIDNISDVSAITFYIPNSIQENSMFMQELKKNGTILSDWYVPVAFSFWGKHSGEICIIIYMVWGVLIFVDNIIIFAKRSLIYWNLLYMSSKKRLLMFSLRNLPEVLIASLIGIFLAYFMSGIGYIEDGILYACNLIGEYVLISVAEGIWLLFYKEQYRFQDTQSIYSEPCAYKKISVVDYAGLRILPYIKNNSKWETLTIDFLRQQEILKYEYYYWNQWNRVQRIKLECYFLVKIVKKDIKYIELELSELLLEEERVQLLNFLQRISEKEDASYESIRSVSSVQKIWKA